MKKILLFLIPAMFVPTAYPAGLGQLFSQNKTTTPAPAHPTTQPQAPKTPANTPALQQATRPQPHPAPAVAPKPAVKPPTTTTAPKPSQPSSTEKSSTEKSKEDKSCNSPTDSTCKR